MRWSSRARCEWDSTLAFLETVTSPGSPPPLVTRAMAHPDRVAIVDGAGNHPYQELLHASARAASVLLTGRADLGEARVAFFIPPSFEHIAIQWGIWRAGGIAVPLALSHPPAELAHVIQDAAAEVVDAPRPAMIVYTSGTTGKSKGVVTTHANIQAQITTLIEAWQWTPEDRVLLVLPLHHVHGIINVVGCALWAGASCEMLPRFDAREAWSRIGSGQLTVFMAVPTIYRKLITAWEAAGPVEQERMSASCRRLRLMVSGSAALPVPLLEEWKRISGHALLERYGMTELGMALSNPLRGERRPGFVGIPLPGLEVRLVDEQGDPVPAGVPGQIEVQGPNVFREYWRRPEETRAAFRDGWFRTGDTAVVEDGYYRILGRSSVDIIKTGGFKVSALEIEEELRTHPAIADCAVLGIEDPDWGERIGIAVELKPGTGLELEDLQDWARERLAPYKIPRVLRCVGRLPRNAMGKIGKPDL